MADVSKQSIVRLQELAHDLSHSVGDTMNLLIQAMNPKLTEEEVQDRLATLLDLSVFSTTVLQKLMWEIGQIAERDFWVEQRTKRQSDKVI